VGILGGWFIGVVVIGVDHGTFWSQMQNAVDFETDVLNGVIKSAVFGVIVTWIALFQGWGCLPTAEGVSRAITKTVVFAALAVLAADFILTALMFMGR
jgi:phospholipid/cholesterol/gamma-HCH transport system permease protein